MGNIGVITGDIVGSGMIQGAGRELLLTTLKNTFREVNHKFLHAKRAPFEVFRGDSFQGKIAQPELSLIISM